MKSQQGAALIMVLLVLLLVTVVGVMAIRAAMTSLNVSTNSQATQLMVQASDTPLNFYLNRMDLGGIVSQGGVIGASISNPTSGREYLYCFKPLNASPMGLRARATVVAAKTDNTGLADIVGGATQGICNLNQDYGSSRQATVTQVVVSVPPPDASAAPGAKLNRSIDLNTAAPVPTNLQKQDTIRVTTVTMFPAFASKSLSDIQSACLVSGKIRISDNSDSRWASAPNHRTLADCLAKEGMPVDVQMQEYNLQTFLTQTAAP